METPIYPKRWLVITWFFVALFFISIAVLIIHLVYWPKCPSTNPDDMRSSVTLWVAVATLVISGVPSMSGVILGWKADRRAARETELRILQLERELVVKAKAKQSKR
jgi:uncharacterized membrane protein